MRNFQIEKPSDELLKEINQKIDTKTKPLGALGQLEVIARQVTLIQNTLAPELKNPHMLVFAADHGVANDGVSAYPQEVTFQMVMNFLQGGAAINVFSKQHGLNLKVVDAGVNFDFAPNEHLIDAKIAKGTKSFLHEPAMSAEQCELAMDKGATLVDQIADQGCNVVGFGEMGIANTSSAAMLMHVFTGLPLEECIGRGTGLDDDGLNRKLNVLSKALAKHGAEKQPMKALATYGGFEIAMITGAMLQAAARKMVILVDGFIASAAFLTAFKLNPLAKEYAIFCHQSEEKGHYLMLEYLQARPLISLGLRLGEGTGCAVAYPILESAVNFFNEMASFESAGVSEKS